MLTLYETQCADISRALADKASGDVDVLRVEDSQGDGDMSSKLGMPLLKLQACFSGTFQLTYNSRGTALPLIS